MNWIEKIQEAIDYIEDNLMEELTVEAVAREIHYAPSSFSQLFSAMTGYSIGEYIRFRRLSCAAEKLSQGRVSITEIGLKYGYETPEAFTKAFKRLFNCPPSRYSSGSPAFRQFNTIRIDYRIQGGFNMGKNFIPGLARVDWSDTKRQNEFVNSVVSALNAIGEVLVYDQVCALSGSAFRTSFSMLSAEPWNHGNYHVIHTPPVIEHTFRMLGVKMTHFIRGDYASDKRRIMESIDQGMPVITLEGVINCADACVISGYDHDGDVLLGYNPFMYVKEDHQEAPDDTGYFRKSNWHGGFFGKSQGRILIIEGKGDRPDDDEAFRETLKLIKRLILEEHMAPGQYNGLAAHRAFAHALLHYEWQDNFEPYLNLMCNYKQYLDRQYGVPFFRKHGREDLARIYEEIAEHSLQLGQLIPQDFSAGDLFSDKENLKPYSELLLKICALEEQAAAVI